VKYTREAHGRFAANVLGYLRAQGFLAPDASPSAARSPRTGLPVVSIGRVVTSEDVRSLDDDPPA
jgi:hypothetical protein